MKPAFTFDNDPEMKNMDHVQFIVGGEEVMTMNKTTEWVSIVWMGNMVEINAKLQIRKERRKRK